MNVSLEAVTIDVMDFRHYWVAAALVASTGAIPARGLWASAVRERHAWDHD